jgi:hypothetical protein
MQMPLAVLHEFGPPAKINLFAGWGPENDMHGLQLLRNGAIAGWFLLCLAQPSVAGPPPAPAPPGLIAGVCSVFAVAATASVASDHHLTGLRARVDGLRRPQIHSIDPLRVHFSLHDLGEYEACQAELLALLAFEPVIARPLPKGAACDDGLQAVSDHMFIRPVETRPVKVLDDDDDPFIVLTETKFRNYCTAFGLLSSPLPHSCFSCSYKIAPFLDATGSNTERSPRTRLLAVIARR